MFKDISGIILTPGNKGEYCLGNGLHYDKTGKRIPVCCDECDFLACCTKENCDCNNCNIYE